MDTPEHREQRAATPPKRVTRRQFFQGGATLVAGSVLAACGVEALDPPSRAPFRAPAEAIALPSPQVAGTPSVHATSGSDALGLEQFLRLSVVLTGFDTLDPVLGRVYLDSLQAASDTAVTPRMLYDRSALDGSTSPYSVDDLGAMGFFDDEAARILADTIIEYWYTGVYQKNGEPAVATYVDALVWDAMAFTKPRTICGPFAGFWEEQPPALP